MDLIDSEQRKFEYLRLSITERCNFRCVYCLPEGYDSRRGLGSEELSVQEIVRLVRAFSQLGVWKVRITGGEPTLRRDLIEIVQAVAETPGVKQVSLTTNGHSLDRLSKSLKGVGLSDLNVSLDSLNAKTFESITGSNRFYSIYRNIEEALSLGYRSVKVNVVLLRGLNSDEFDSFLSLVERVPISVRFIELMKTRDNEELFHQRYMSGGDIKLALLCKGWSLKPQEKGAGPAVVFRHPHYLGSIGVIAPYSKDFCKSCNRLRVTSQGGLKLCLFGSGEVSLRHLLKTDSQKEELAELILKSLAEKPKSHRLQEGIYGNTHHLASVGG